MDKATDTEFPDVEALEQELQRLTLQARAVCQTAGDGSKVCAIAWDAVQNLQVTVANRRRAERNQTFFDRYCSDHPDALECRIYEV